MREPQRGHFDLRTLSSDRAEGVDQTVWPALAKAGRDEFGNSLNHHIT